MGARPVSYSVLLSPSAWGLVAPLSGALRLRIAAVGGNLAEDRRVTEFWSAFTGTGLALTLVAKASNRSASRSKLFSVSAVRAVVAMQRYCSACARS
jgi:hypothetical protein